MARNTSRFNKILNFIGLVDEQDNRETDYDQGRPSGASTYVPSSRRAPQSSARPVRSAGYEDPRYGGGRYEADRDYPPRDYPPRDYQSAPRDYPPRDYGASSGSYRNGEYTRQSRPDERDRISSRPDYEPRQSSYRQEPRAPQRAANPRDDYYSQRQPQQPPREYAAQSEPRGNVVSLRSDPRMHGAQTVIYYLHALEECREVISDLLDNKTVLLNLEDMDERLIQRGIDTLCGAAFALNATLRKASDKTYLIAPNSVNVASPGSDEFRF